MTLTSSLLTIENIEQLLGEIVRDSITIFKQTKRAIGQKIPSGEMDEELEAEFSRFTDHIRQFEMEFLHLIVRHASIMESGSSSIIESMKRGKRVDPKILEHYRKGLAQLTFIADRISRVEMADMRRGQMLAFDAQSIKKQIQGKVLEIDANIRSMGRIFKRQEIDLKKKEEAIKEAKKAMR